MRKHYLWPKTAAGTKTDTTMLAWHISTSGLTLSTATANKVTGTRQRLGGMPTAFPYSSSLASGSEHSSLPSLAAKLQAIGGAEYIDEAGPGNESPFPCALELLNFGNPTFLPPAGNNTGRKTIRISRVADVGTNSESKRVFKPHARFSRLIHGPSREDLRSFAIEACPKGSCSSVVPGAVARLRSAGWRGLRLPYIG
ncbi:hypothetical protein V6N12_073391 [Hibiscus sabdariffa]|uniref:Uncharacterized protein n=1 Tax=Hibiscus sabdariffa TaxID=183260 RepID=A0ABR2BTA4_9ROSI